NPHWHKGAIFMARDAQVPLVLAYFDYKNKVVCIDREFELSDDADADLVRIKQYFEQHGSAKYPENFVTGLE
ncbi:MAG: acyltransferase, partial [Muribaculaceae bacterium]|nr:acyltransferase [Muribaculaceae bacterium]